MAEGELTALTLYEAFAAKVMIVTTFTRVHISALLAECFVASAAMQDISAFVTEGIITDITVRCEPTVKTVGFLTGATESNDFAVMAIVSASATIITRSNIFAIVTKLSHTLIALHDEITVVLAALVRLASTAEAHGSPPFKLFRRNLVDKSALALFATDSLFPRLFRNCSIQSEKKPTDSCFKRCEEVAGVILLSDLDKFQASGCTNYLIDWGHAGQDANDKGVIKTSSTHGFNLCFGSSELNNLQLLRLTQWFKALAANVGAAHERE